MIRRDVPDEEIEGAIEYYREMRKCAPTLEPWQALLVMAEMATKGD